MDTPRNNLKTSWITIAVLCAAVAGLLLLTQKDALRETYDKLFIDSRIAAKLPEPVSYDEIVDTNSNADANVNGDSEQIEPQQPKSLPVEFLLEVSFTTQAPHANWELPYQEACEEASALTVHYFYEQKSFTQGIADQEILALVDFENKTYGDYKDTTAQETADFIKAYWGYNRVDVIDNPTVDDIKRAVASGHPVIVPAAGRMLGNSHFTGEGPLYHMFVVTGYTESEFITNDVGTRFGEDYTYAYDTVMNAMHDWNDGDVANGAKKIIVVYPN